MHDKNIHPNRKAYNLRYTPIKLFAVLLMFQCFVIDAIAQTSNFVSVDQHLYTTQQLVQDILLDTGFSTISNITASAGNINGNYGIGYFNKNNSNFPIEEGVVIRSGHAKLSEGPLFDLLTSNEEPTFSSEASGIGDPDLQVVSDGVGKLEDVQDVSYLQFDFVPLFNEFSFDFLFASNEYGFYQCDYTDVFAFLIKDLSVPGAPYINIALIPGTNTPVSATTIRDSSYNSYCPSANAAFFGQYNELNPNASAINFLGQTVVMQAISPVVAGHTYRIKLAVGDYWDSFIDCAVFIAGDSFKIVDPCLPPLNAGITVQPNCSVPTGEITVYSPLGPDMEFSIDGLVFQTAHTFSNLAPGTYTITARNAAGCTSVKSDIIINPAPVVPPIASGTIVQPTCTVPWGTIMVGIPVGPDLTYSINGVDFQTGTTFNNIAPGSYTISVKNAEGCTSVRSNVDIETWPNAPAIADVTIIQPTCIVSTGVITIDSPLGVDLTYSINGVDFQAATIFNNLAPGTYTVTVKNADGCTSVRSNIIINAAPIAPAIADVAVTQPTCTVSSGTITVNNPLGAGLTYSLNGVDFQAAVTFSNLAPGTYTVTVKNADGCTSEKPNITINAVPAVPSIAWGDIIQPTCDDPSGTITVLSPLGTGLTYSINGVDFQTGTTFSNLIPGTYAVTVKNADGCTSVRSNIIINAAPIAPAIADVTVTQPTCTVSSGTITVNNPLGAGLTYSINGVDFQAATIFNNLAPGTYAVTVKNADGCTSEKPNVIINAAPAAPAIADVAVTQPTCTVSSGTITVNNPLGAGLTYSINGVDFQAATIFNNLAPGTYTVTVKNADGCTSEKPNVIINAAPAAPAIADVAVTQPTCTVSMGTITIDSPLGTDLTYSLNGVDFQNNTTFSDLAPGTYTVTVKNADGCTSEKPNVIINAAPAAPAIADVAVTQPTCTVSSGTITVNNPLGAGLTYSLNGVDFQAAVTFSNLAPGTYTVTVQNADGCTSEKPNVIIIAAPAALSVPTVTAVQPTCTVPLGTITIDSPLGVGLTYSLNGVDFQAATIFNNLAPGTYTVTVKSADGCTSVRSNIIINAAPAAPPVAMVSVVQPTCTVSTGTITIDSPLGAGLTYSIYGVDFQTTTTFNNLAPGTYAVTVQNADGCTSEKPNVIIIAAPAAPPVAMVSVVQPTCTVSTGTIIINSPLGADLTYSINGVDFQTGITFNNVVPGIYKVTAQNNNCRFVSPDILINTPPNSLPPIHAPIQLQQCDTYGENDGFSVFNLTQIETNVLGGQNPNGYDITYHLSEVDAHSGANPIADPTIFENTIADTQTIWMRISTRGCDNVISINVKVERLPVPVIQGGTICVDYNTGATLRPLIIDTGLDDAGYDFVWFLDGVPILNETTTTLIAGKPGKYTVQATSRSANACVSRPVEEVTVVRSGAAIPIGLGYNIKNASGGKQIITVKVHGYGTYEYSLNDGPWQVNPVFVNVSFGNHIIKVMDTNADACEEIVIEIINKIDFPNFFTPNGDGFRDVWNIYSLRGAGAVIYIFDRYGKIIKQISPDKDGWNGTINGEQAPATDYWFTVTYPEFSGTTTETKEFKSHFSLKR